METKFTPGPWDYERRLDPSDLAAPWVGRLAEQQFTALACGETAEQRIENAKLIAAAPALYEALDTLFTDPQFQVSIGGNPNMVEALMARCNAALALARGETCQPPSRVGLDPDAGTREPNQEKTS